MAKVKTNKQVLIKAAKELDDSSLAMLRVTLISICETIVNNPDEVRKQYSPDSYINPEWIIDSHKKVLDYIKFEE